MDGSRRVLIVGGGFAGVEAARALERHALPGVRVSLVSSENFMQYQPFLPEVASGTIDPRAAVVPLRGVLRRTEVVIGEVRSIDHEARCAKVSGIEGHPFELTYEDLVLTAGSWSRVLPVPGLAEHGVGFKTVQEAIYLRNRVLSRLDVAAETDDPRRRRAALTFVFVGAGYAGVEAIGELEDLARDALSTYERIGPDDCHWVLVDAGPRILPELPEDLAGYARRRLTGRGIDVRVGTRLEAVDGAEIRFSDGSVVEADTLVWTAGVTPVPLAAESGLPLDERGRIRVDATLRVVGVPGAWAAGDVAAVPDVTTDGTCPPTAQYALRQGRRLGENLARTIEGSGIPEPFVWRNVGGVCSLGRYKGVANVMGVKLTGFAGWFLHRSYHLWAMPTLGRRVRIAVDWTVALLFARDTAQLGSFQHPREPFRRAAEREGKR
jgi:NADH dehydrogenase